MNAPKRKHLFARNRTLCVILSITSLLLLTACATTTIPATGSSNPEEDDIREAVFRWQFEHNESGRQQNVDVICISIKRNSDPADTFMNRFSSYKRPVKKGSACAKDLGGVYEKETRKRGLIFWTGDIHRISDSEVEVWGGYYEGGLSSSANSYILENQNGKWVVIKDNLVMIS